MRAGDQKLRYDLEWLNGFNVTRCLYKHVNVLINAYRSIDNRDYVKWIGNGKIYPRYV